MLESIFDGVAGLKVCNFIKKTLTQVFSCVYCEIFRNSFFWTTSATSEKELLNSSSWLLYFSECL